MAIPDPPLTETSSIVMAARDELPETYDKLVETPTFGEGAVERRLATLVYRVFGTDVEPLDMDPLLVSYLGKRLALDLIVPGIDYWSKQVLSLSAGERETKAFKDRAEDLKELRKLLLEDTSKLLPEVQDLFPQIPRRAADTARVIESGFSTIHVTPNPSAFPPLYGLPEETGLT